MQDPRTSQFTFGASSISAVPQERLMKGIEKNGEIFEILYPVFVETGFLANTKFRSLHLSFWLVPEHYIEGEIAFIHRKRDRSLAVMMNLHQSKALDMFESDYVRYALSNVATMLQAVCRKYSLNESAVNSLRRRYSLSENPATKRLNDTVDVQQEDELRVHVKLSDQTMGDMDQFVANTNIIEAADQILNDQNGGRFDASEIGMGFETIFLVGPSAQKMYAALEAILSTLPSGSYAELVSQEGSQRIEL